MNNTSKLKLATAHDDLQMLAHAVDRECPIQVICGARNEKDQNAAKKTGKSELEYPNSKHNINPNCGRFKSHAIDCVPDPDRSAATIDWDNVKEFEKMCEMFEKKADELSIKIRLGRDFKMRDLPHIELL